MDKKYQFTAFQIVFFFLGLKICFGYKRISTKTVYHMRRKESLSHMAIKFSFMITNCFVREEPYPKLWTPFLYSIVNSAGFGS